MAIHKIVGKHTTGDVRNYVGSAGELFYDDATGLIRLADGFTEGGNALVLNEYEDQFVMLTTPAAWPEAATSISNDAVFWTPALSTAEYVDWYSDYEAVYFNQTAIGGGRIVYLGFDDNVGRNCVFWAESANQAPNRSFSPAANQADEANGFDTSCLWLEDVEYINNYFVVVGYQQRYESYNGGTNNVKYPFWAYSTNGEHWTYGKVDYSSVRQIIDYADTNLGTHTYGIQIASVGGGGNAGMMFTLRYNSNSYYGTAGFYYLNDVGSSMNPQTHSGLPGITDQYAPFLENYQNAGFRSIWHDDHGWTVWSNNYGMVHFNSNTDPRDGKWRSVSWQEVARRAFGSTSTCIYWAAAGRLKDGKSYIMMTGNDGRYFATADQGSNWLAGVIGNAHNYTVNDISTGTNTQIILGGNTNFYGGGYYDIVKIKIAGSNIPEMNGYFYGHRINNDTFRLSYNGAEDYVDSSAWASYNSGSATCYFSYGNRMDFLTYGAGTFMAVDHTAPYVYSVTDLTTPWDFETIEPYDPVSGDITGNNPTDFTWYAGNWKAVAAQISWNGPWDGVGCISFGRIGVHSGLLRSNSRRIAGRTNVLNLADNFSVDVINGVQGGEMIGYGHIELRPGLPGGLWTIGAGYFYGPGTSIGSEALDNEYTTVAITLINGGTWSFRSDGIYHNGVRKVEV